MCGSCTWTPGAVCPCGHRRRDDDRPVEAAGAVDAQNASTAPWKTETFSTSSHRPCYRCVDVRLLPMSWRQTLQGCSESRAEACPTYLFDDMRPRIALTAGDPAGIGPEVAAKAAADARVLAACDPIVYAPP